MAAERFKSGFQSIADAIGPDIHVNLFDPDGDLNIIGFSQFMAMYERDNHRFNPPIQPKKKRKAKCVQDPRESVWWKLYVLDPNGLYRMSYGREGSESDFFEFCLKVRKFRVNSSVTTLCRGHDGSPTFSSTLSGAMESLQRHGE